VIATEVAATPFSRSARGISARIPKPVYGGSEKSLSDHLHRHTHPLYYPPHIPHALPSSALQGRPCFVFLKCSHVLLCRTPEDVLSQYSFVAVAGCPTSRAGATAGSEVCRGSHCVALHCHGGWVARPVLFSCGSCSRNWQERVCEGRNFDQGSELWPWFSLAIIRRTCPVAGRIGACPLPRHVDGVGFVKRFPVDI